MEVKLKGKLSKKFFNYLREKSLDINDLTNVDMLRASLDTGISYNYGQVLKSCYKDDKISSIIKKKERTKS